MSGKGKKTRGIRGAVLGAMVAVASLLPSTGAFAQPTGLAEFRANQTIQFSSRGHAKSRGLHITLRYPRSWLPAEGERPHVVQKFTATDGTAANCNLGIRESGVSAAQTRAAVQPAAARGQLPDGAILVASQATSLDGQPGSELMIRQSLNRAGVAIESRLVLYFVAYGQDFVVLTCGAGGRSAADADRLFQTYLPLFRRIALSVVFQDRYRETGRAAPSRTSNRLAPAPTPSNKAASVPVTQTCPPASRSRANRAARRLGSRGAALSSSRRTGRRPVRSATRSAWARIRPMSRAFCSPVEQRPAGWFLA